MDLESKMIKKRNKYLKSFKKENSTTLKLFTSKKYTTAKVGEETETQIEPGQVRRHNSRHKENVACQSDLVINNIYSDTKPVGHIKHLKETFQW